MRVTNVRRCLDLLSVVLIVFSGTSASAGGNCTPSDTVLCLEGSRFSVEVTWSDGAGAGEDGRALVFNDATGLFTFFDDRYVEMYVSVLDGCSINDRFWVFAGIATDLGFTLAVTDTVAATTKQYVQIAGAPQAITDTQAFATCAMSPSASIGTDVRRLTMTASPPRDLVSGWLDDTESTKSLAPCVSDAATLCLVGSRFSVSAAWRDFTGSVGDGMSVPLTSHSGAFWFFSPDNLEVLVKIVEDCAFEVHAGGDTDVELDLTITDTVTGTQTILQNPLGTTFADLSDLESFPNEDPPPLELTDLAIYDTRVYENCRIATGPGFFIGTTGDVTLRAPLVILRHDTTVDPGGRLTVATAQ